MPIYAQAVSMGQKRLLKTTPLEASMVTVVPFFRMFVADSAPTITGFSNAVTSPALDFKSEGFVTGMAAKMFTVAGPVITFGTLASVIYGVILMLLK